MEKRGQFTGRRFALVMMDAAATFAVGALWLPSASRELRIILGLWLIAATILPMLIAGAYARVLRTSLSNHVLEIAIACLSSLLTTKALSLWLRAQLDWSALMAVTLVLFAVLFGIRVGLLRAHECFLRPWRLWVVAEDEPTAYAIARKAAAYNRRYEIVAWSGMRELEQIPERLQRCDGVLCTTAVRKFFESVCAQFGKELMLVPGPSEVLLTTATVRQIDDLLVLSVAPLALTTPQKFCKRCFDIFGAALLLLICSPVMVVLLAAIPRESVGPAIYRQRRRGSRGKPFELLKFRTMTADAEDGSGPVLAISEDPRVTRMGRWMRATRIDELPQLWNVLKGEMSLVGPRPEREYFAQQFDRELTDYPLRTAVKPGLTGLAQVWGRYSTTAESKLRLDLMYIANYSLFFDVQLLMQTLRVVLQREQAAGVSSGPALPVRLSPEGMAEEQRQA
ncbi:Undecaprenyl-phosphate galactosephosphotransferase [Candidatus Koribacter versatilis Ellin345]|uniref:Undecaprenyl-phosphate galactosephosphotransferase n=1 Tax=Koribacter versatilis (strain Ellin345) TaxID=204669 RepID=Q1IN23_KORVE|nr:sugar transferase [Candidatus Koribacter versatilis]ABF41727.1 Undecaprenyl-phosphate galactosephosphotransferase [Candidatus Koribacter versatilis Ellin345]